jgi:hypothetical protein
MPCQVPAHWNFAHVDLSVGALVDRREAVVVLFQVAHRGADANIGVRCAVTGVDGMESGQSRGVGGRPVDLSVDADQAEVEDDARDHQHGGQAERDDDGNGAALVTPAERAEALSHDAVHVGATSRP